MVQIMKETADVLGYKIEIMHILTKKPECKIINHRFKSREHENYFYGTHVGIRAHEAHFYNVAF